MGYNYLIYTDGSAQHPPPGRISFTAIVIDTNREMMFSRCDVQPKGTSNQAEYLGVILGLNTLRKIGGSHALIISDSELVVKQINGKCSTRNQKLIELKAVAIQLMRKTKSDICHDSRSNKRIGIADAICGMMNERYEYIEDLERLESEAEKKKALNLW